MRTSFLPLIFSLVVIFGMLGVLSVAHATGLDTTTGSVLGNTTQTDGSLGTGNGGSQSLGTGNGDSGTTLMNPLQGGTSLESFLNSILTFVIRIGAIIVVLMLVYVGYLFVVAQGNDSKLTEARKALLWTIIGALVLLGAQAISIGIQSTVNALSAGR